MAVCLAPSTDDDGALLAVAEVGLLLTASTSLSGVNDEIDAIDRLAAAAP